MEWTRVCRNCGKTFITNTQGRFYCNDDCRIQANYIRQHTGFPSNSKEIAELNQKAREKGLSYGEYVGTKLHVPHLSELTKQSKTDSINWKSFCWKAS